MNLMESAFPIEWQIGGALVFVPILLWTLRSVRWSVFRQEALAQHLFYGTVFTLSCLWLIRGGILPGLEIHFLGITAAVLFMGWPLGVLAGTLALFISTLLDFHLWQELGIQGCLRVLFPATVTWMGYRLAERRLPPNPFIYIMVCGFMTAGIAMATVVTAISVSLWLAGTYIWEVIFHNYFRYFLLFMFPEAFLNGALIGTVFLVSPHWISTFNEDVFFRDDD